MRSVKTVTLLKKNLKPGLLDPMPFALVNRIALQFARDSNYG